MITSIKIESCINKDMIVTLGSRLRSDSFKEKAKLDDIEDVILSIDGGFGSPKFHMMLYKRSITLALSNDVLDISITLVDKYNRFREIDILFDASDR